MSFPTDDYTPYGYLDLHKHTSRLSPKGVMRSSGVGFRWHFPALVAAYGGSQDRYQAGVRLLDGSPEEFKVPYHSGRVMVFVPNGDRSAPELSWFMINDDCLAVRAIGRPGDVVCWEVDYERTVASDGSWGESGLIGRIDGTDVVLQSFEDGDAFVVRVTDARLETDLGPDQDNATATALGSRGDRRRVGARLTARLSDNADNVTSSWLFMSRGSTERAARANLPTPADAAGQLHLHRAADAEFWARAPVLDGDWPGHWRRGLVYDLETLRMMIKEPIGIYHHPWDAMQIQAPRVVLAEAAMDALALSWAHPELAADLLLGTFSDAPEPNVPCSREDGSYNMVAADGTVCGTGPQWGYPFLVADRIAGALTDPTDWIRQLYRPMADYLSWWLSERVDNEGWLVHACSWESGQDLSPRFGDQPLGGGHPTRHLRPADLHAAAAHAAGVLREFAAAVAPTEVEAWRAVEADLTGRARQLWAHTRFADFDRRSGEFTDVVDPMLFAAPALGVASAEQVETGVEALAKINSAELVWPMFVWTPVLAAQQADRRDIAGELAASIVDRAYRHWDARSHNGSTTLPGIASEYWPEHGRCGGEGYGWGAFSTELLVSHVIGLCLTDSGVQVAPSLPTWLARPGAAYGVTMTLRGRRVRFRIIIDQDGQPEIVGPDGVRSPGTVRHWRWQDL